MTVGKLSTLFWLFLGLHLEIIGERQGPYGMSRVKQG